MKKITKLSILGSLIFLSGSVCAAPFLDGMIIVGRQAVAKALMGLTASGTKAFTIGHIAGRRIKLEADEVVTDQPNGDTLLAEAAYEGQLKIAKFLLAEGYDVNATSERLATPLHAALYRGHSTVCGSSY